MSSGVVRKKQDNQDKFLTALRELVNTGGGNRQCFDCGQKGPTYVNMQIGSFVCTRCSGVLRGLTPPHRVKSISMATFTQEEIDFLKAHGNDECAKTWLGLWDPKRAIHQDQRELMIDKYERKRYYLEPASPLKSLTNAASLKATTSTTSQSASQLNGYSNQQQQQQQQQQHTTLTNGHKTSNLDNGFNNIQLTPPTSQRTTANGLQHNKSSSSVISRPQHHSHQNGFNNQNQQDAFMLNGNSNGNGNGFLTHHGFGGGSAGSTSTGAMSDTSSCASNGFGPDADFVADFGSADIFNATSASSVGSPAVSSASSVASSNGYAKIQPIKAARQQQQQQQQQFMNGHANGQLNETSSTNGNGSNENFADFEHAPIYNATANYQFISKSNLNRSNAVKLTQQRIQQQQCQQYPKTTATTASTNTTAPIITSKKINDFFNSNEFDFIADRKNNINNYFSRNDKNFNDEDDADDDVVGTLAKIISNGNGNGNGNNRSNMQQQRKSTNIIYSESTSNFNDPFDDFNTIISSSNNNINITNRNSNNNNNIGSSNSSSQLNHSNNYNKAKFVTFESDFDEISMATQQHQQQQQQHQQQQQTQTQNSNAAKFTPLAMAAHATAMAVLGSDYHFNKTNNYNKTNENNQYQIVDNNISNNNNNNNITSINKKFNSYRNPFDAEQSNVWQESTMDNSNNKNYNYNSTNVPLQHIDDDYSNTNHYIPLTEFTTAMPYTQQHFQPASNSNWFESTPDSYTTSTYHPTSTTSINSFNEIFSKSTIKTTTQNNLSDNKIETSQMPESMSSILNCKQNNSVEFLNRLSTNRSSVLSPSMLTLSSYPSTNPFSTNFLQESFTNCDNSCTTFVTTPTTTITTVANISCNTNTTLTTTSTFSNTTTVMPLEVFARTNLTTTTTTTPDSSQYHSSFPSTSCSSNFLNSVNSYANFDSNFDSSNRLSSGGWSAIPIPNVKNKNSLSASNNNNLSSTPSEDRYAALKDLDEQLRESKAVAATAATVVASSVLDSFGNNNNNNLAMPNAGSINPFKSQQQNPFQIATANNLQHQQQQQQNIYGQLTVIPNGMPTATNGFGAQQTPPQPTAFFNYSNGFTSASLQGGMNAATAGQTSTFSTMTGVPNGCGFGFGTGVGTVNGIGNGVGVGVGVGAYVNPFATSGAMNTNNPFL